MLVTNGIYCYILMQENMKKISEINKYYKIHHDDDELFWWKCKVFGHQTDSRKMGTVNRNASSENNLTFLGTNLLSKYEEGENFQYKGTAYYLQQIISFG